MSPRIIVLILIVGTVLLTPQVLFRTCKYEDKLWTTNNKFVSASHYIFEISLVTIIMITIRNISSNQFENNYMVQFIELIFGQHESRSIYNYDSFLEFLLIFAGIFIFIQYIYYFFCVDTLFIKIFNAFVSFWGCILRGELMIIRH